jgi:hypothetical protein
MEKVFHNLHQMVEALASNVPISVFALIGKVFHNLLQMEEACHANEFGRFPQPRLNGRTLSCQGSFF